MLYNFQDGRATWLQQTFSDLGLSGAFWIQHDSAVFVVGSWANLRSLWAGKAYLAVGASDSQGSRGQDGTGLNPKP